MRRLIPLPALLMLIVCWQSGCQFLPHALQPDQLWKMNRQPAMDVRFQSPHSVENTRQSVVDPTAG